MNKLVESGKVGLVMNSSGEYQEWLHYVPDPLPATHFQSVEWEKRGNLKILWIGTAPHPIELVAQVTNHFEDLDEQRLLWLCGNADITQKQIDARIEQAAKLDPPKDLKPRDAMILLLRDECPAPAKGAKPLAVPTKSVQVRERVIVLPADISEMKVETLEKIAAQCGGINTFKAQQNKGATLAELRALVARMREGKKNREEKERAGGRAGLLQRA